MGNEGDKMLKQIKELLTSTDDTRRLKYLLAKDDIDDLQAAAQIVSNWLMQEFPYLTLKTTLNRIGLEERTEKFLTILHIRIEEEHLIISYKIYSEPDLFNQITGCDIKMVGKIINVITRLGFYKTGENKIIENGECWQNEIYKLDVIRRKL